jgi:hypothetical protein
MQNVIKDLKSSGKWDSTMLVVTADHGISFIPASPQRNTDFTDPEQVADVYRIPTFIKYPNQKSGTPSDCAITNLDLLPTIIDVTQTKSSWAFAGKSLVGDCPTGRMRSIVAATGEKAVLSGGFEEVRARAAHYSGIVSNVGPIRNVAAIGNSASLIGVEIGKRPTDQLITSWTMNQKRLFKNVATERGATIPGLITGKVTLSQPLDAGTEGVIAVDGVAAGVIGELSGASSTVSYAAVLDYTLLSRGSHDVELFIRYPDGTLTSVGAPS